MHHDSPGQLPWGDSSLQLSLGQEECPLQHIQWYSGTMHWDWYVTSILLARDLRIATLPLPC